MESKGTRTFATNALFGAFFLSIFGWGLLHACAVHAGAGGFTHALITVPCLCLCGIVLYRFSRHWPARQSMHDDHKEGVRLSMNFLSAICYLMLAAIGTGMALVVSGGSVLFQATAALGLVAIPWTRIPVCRNRFLVSSGMLGLGAFFGLALSSRPLHPMSYMLSAWVLLSMAATLALFIVMTHRNRFDRMPASGY